MSNDLGDRRRRSSAERSNSFKLKIIEQKTN